MLSCSEPQHATLVVTLKAQHVTHSELHLLLHCATQQQQPQYLSHLANNCISNLKRKLGWLSYNHNIHEESLQLLCSLVTTCRVMVVT